MLQDIVNPSSHSKLSSNDIVFILYSKSVLSLELLKVSIIKNKVLRSKMEDINTDFK